MAGTCCSAHMFVMACDPNNNNKTSNNKSSIWKATTTTTTASKLHYSRVAVVASYPQPHTHVLATQTRPHTTQLTTWCACDHIALVHTYTATCTYVIDMPCDMPLGLLCICCSCSLDRHCCFGRPHRGTEAQMDRRTGGRADGRRSVMQCVHTAMRWSLFTHRCNGRTLDEVSSQAGRRAASQPARYPTNELSSHASAASDANRQSSEATARTHR